MGEAKKPVILSAEDDPDDRLLIQDAVETICPSLCLQFVHDGKELLDYLYKAISDPHGLPTLVLLDLNMPLMDGREALKKIKMENSFKDLPIVILTTSDEERDREICRQFGADDFFSKPSSFDDIVSALDGVISKWMPCS